MLPCWLLLLVSAFAALGGRLRLRIGVMGELVS